MAAVQDNIVESTMEKGPETAGAHNEHAVVTSAGATKRRVRAVGFVKSNLKCLIKGIIGILTIITLVVLAFQIYEDQRDYDALEKKYHELADATSGNALVVRAIWATDDVQVLTSTIAPFITTTDEIGTSVLPCTGVEHSTSTSMAAAPIATSITPAGYSLGSLYSETLTATVTMTMTPSSTTLDVTTVTIPRSTLTLTTTVITGSASFLSSAEPLSGTLLSSSSTCTEEMTTTTTIVQPATVTASLAAVSSSATDASSYPLLSSELTSETETCDPATPLTTTPTIMVSSSPSLQSLTTTTVSVINTLTTVTTAISGQHTVVVTQTTSPSSASVLSSADALSGSISSTMAPNLGTSVFGTAGGTTVTLTSTASNNYTVSHTGGPVAGATISVSGGTKGPKTFGANDDGKPGGTVFCAVMVVTALLSLFI